MIPVRFGNMQGLEKNEGLSNEADNPLCSDTEGYNEYPNNKKKLHSYADHFAVEQAIFFRKRYTANIVFVFYCVSHSNPSCSSFQ